MEGAAVVSTADPFHHGIGYGDAPEDSFDHDAAGLARAKAVIEDGMRLLEQGDYWGYTSTASRRKATRATAGRCIVICARHDGRSSG